jgi:hypothetical protein
LTKIAKIVGGKLADPKGGVIQIRDHNLTATPGGVDEFSQLHEAKGRGGRLVGREELLAMPVAQQQRTCRSLARGPDKAASLLGDGDQVIPPFHDDNMVDKHVVADTKGGGGQQSGTPTILEGLEDGGGLEVGAITAVERPAGLGGQLTTLVLALDVDDGGAGGEDQALECGRQRFVTRPLSKLPADTGDVTTFPHTQEAVGLDLGEGD